MNIDPLLHRFARDIPTGDDIQLDQGMELARQLKTFLLDADLGLQNAEVYFMQKPEEPKALRIHLFRIQK
jgi:hypothetical protein